MSQTYNLPVGSASVSTNLLTNVLNDLEALRSSFSGASAPINPTPVAGQLFWDTSVGRLKLYDGVDWNSSIPRLDANETITGVWTFQGTVPQFRFMETGVAVDNGRWQFSADGEALRFHTLNDADTLSTLWLEVNRTGIVVDNIYLNTKVGIGGLPTTKLHIYDDTVNFGTTLEQANGAGKILQLKATVSDNLNTTSAVDVEIDTVSVFKVTNAGNVAIGNVTPDTTLHVYRGNSGGSSSTYSGLTVEDDAEVYLQILTPNVNIGGILFGDSESPSVGQIRYNHVDNNLSFVAGGVSTLSINSSGQLVSSLTGSSPLVLSGVKTPISATDTGTLGEVCRDTNYLYVCTATNTWKRAALSTW